MRLKVSPLVVGDVIILEYGFIDNDGRYLDEDERTFAVTDVDTKYGILRYTVQSKAGQITKITHADITHLVKSDSIEIRRLNADTD